MLTIVIMFYITSPILTYFITVSVYVFNHHPIPPIPSPASGNHKPDLFFHEFGFIYLFLASTYK